jgi:hypothetical protein
VLYSHLTRCEIDIINRETETFGNTTANVEKEPYEKLVSE